MRDSGGGTLSRRIAVFAALAVAVAAAVAGGSVASKAASAPKLTSELNGPTVPGQLLVRFRQGASSDSIAFAHNTVGAQVLQTFQIVPNLQLVSIPDSLTAATAIDSYRLSPDVLYAQPNFVYHIDGVDKTPNDPRYPEMW